MMNSEDEIIEMARQAGLLPCQGIHMGDLKAFVKLVEAKKQADINALYALYEQACSQRDMLMDQQRSQIAAMRGKLT
jgi:hypothetical protein